MVKKNYDNMLCRFHLIPERHGETDGQTDGRMDRIAISISRVSVLTRDKNWTFYDNVDSSGPTSIIILTPLYSHTSV